MSRLGCGEPILFLRIDNNLLFLFFAGYSENNSDSETESRSPSPSSGVESNSFKDSPMQIDVMALDQGFGKIF